MPTTLDERSVIVFGAGATKAFLPDAPMLEDDYGLKRLKNHFSAFPYAHQLLLFEEDRLQNGNLNIERLMTRLEGRMPYDSQDATDQQAHLLCELKREFIRKFELARRGKLHREELAQFAKICVKNQVTCITFNYDDVLDQALWEVESRYLEGPAGKSGLKYWHPDGGYGFFCRPSYITVNNTSSWMDKTSMCLLKLHGSINWFARRGERQPFNLDSIYHNEDWYPPKVARTIPGLDSELIPRHLQTEPFIIPPVLDKTVLAREPILQLVWSMAKEALQAASKIYFVGYSLPMTDLAAAYLFHETVGRKCHVVKVINLADTEDKRNEIRASYRKVLPNLKDDQFYFDGALDWIGEITA